MSARRSAPDFGSGPTLDRERAIRFTVRPMSTRTTVERLGDHVGQSVTLYGWLYHKSSKGKLHFAQLRDGTGVAQCVLFKGSVPEALFEAVGKAGQESSLILTGDVTAEPR